MAARIARRDSSCSPSAQGCGALGVQCSDPYSSGLNVMSAIAIAGGPTYRASRSSILVQHPGEAGMHEYPLTSTIPILPGDIIKVPQRYF